MSSFGSVEKVNISNNESENNNNSNIIKNNDNESIKKTEKNKENNSNYSISSEGLLNIINFSSQISSLNENKNNLSLPFVCFCPFYPKLNVNLNLYTQSSFSFLNDININNKNDDFNLNLNENNNKESKQILTEYENMLNRIYNNKSSSSIFNSSFLLSGNNKNKQLNTSNISKNIHYSNLSNNNIFSNTNNINNNNNINNSNNKNNKNNNNNINNINNSNSNINTSNFNNSNINNNNDNNNNYINNIGEFYMNSNYSYPKNINSNENTLKNALKTPSNKFKRSKIEDSNLNSTLNEYYLKQTVNRNNLENYQTTTYSPIVDKKGKKIEGSFIKEKEVLQSIIIKKLAHKPRVNVRNDFLSENEKKIYADDLKKRDIVDVRKCENLLEKNLTRNFTPDMKPVRDKIKKRDIEIKKKKGIPTIEYKVDFDSIKKRNDQIELTKTIKFKQSLMHKSNNKKKYKNSN